MLCWTCLLHTKAMVPRSGIASSQQQPIMFYRHISACMPITDSSCSNQYRPKRMTCWWWCASLFFLLLYWVKNTSLVLCRANGWLNPKLKWLEHLLRCFFTQMPGVDPQLTGGILYLVWITNPLDSLRRSCWWNVSRSTELLLQWPSSRLTQVKRLDNLI